MAAYVGVVQDRPPIFRAALMAAFYLLARPLFRRIDLLNTVALAALALLIWKPSSLSDSSFQLSFLAAGVIAGAGASLDGPHERTLSRGACASGRRDARRGASAEASRNSASRCAQRRNGSLRALPHRLAAHANGLVAVPFAPGCGSGK